MPSKLSYQELEERVLRLEKESINYRRIQKVLETRLKLMDFAQFHSIDEILRQTLDQVETLTDSIFSFYHFVGTDQKTLSLQMWSTHTAFDFCRAEGKESGSRNSIDRAGVWVDCVHQRKAVIHNDYSSLKYRKGLPEGDVPITRELVAPIFRNDRIVAVVGVGNKRQEYNDGDVEIVTNIADLVWDIIERKREDEKLVRNEQILNTTQEITKVGGWQWNIEDKTMFWTDETYRIHGIDPEAISSGSTEYIQRSLECYHASDQPIILQAFKTCKNEGVSYDLTLPFTAFDGVQKWIRTIAKAVVRDGNIIKILGNICDITREKEQELKWIQDEQKYHNIIQTITDGFWLVDVNGNIIDVNPAYCRMSCYTRQELLCMSISDLEALETRGDIAENICTTKKSGSHHFETKQKRKDGSYFDVEVNSTYLPERKQFVVFLRDISERIRETRELLESEERFKAIHDASFGGIVIHEQGLILACNQGLADMTGFSNEELVGMNGLKLIAPDSLDQVLKNIRRGYDQYYEVEGLRKNGSVYPLAIRGKNIHYKGREVRVIEFRDITRRKMAEGALRESEQRFRGLANLLPQTVFEADVQGNLTYSNQMGLEVTGYSLEDIKKGLNVNQIIVPKERSKLLKNFTRIIIERIDSNSEYMILRKDGTIFPGIVYCRPVVQNDEVVGLVGIVADISDRKTAEEEKARLEAQLQQSQKMEAIGIMAGGIAHDFNNMLAIIIGNADMALDDIPEGNPGRYNVNQIIEASQRVKDLVKQILTFSRQDHQELIPLKPNVIIKESLKLLRSTTPTTVSIVQNICTDCGTIMADSTQIHQVLMNLCTNSIHAMDEKGTIEVIGLMVDLETEDIPDQPGIKPGHYFKLSIRDTGIGITRELQNRIFDPFYTTQEVGEGTGMGLSIVLGIVKSHRGFIQVDSEPGKGSVFTLFFPTMEEVQTQKTVKITEENLQGNERVLFVDDEEMLAMIGGRLLERLGYKVTVKTSSNDALKTFKSDPDSFDLVITDQSMPNMSGAELTTELLNTRPDIPVILCTGYSKKISEEESKKLGIKKYLLKPLDRRALAKSIREVLKQ